MRKSLLFVLVIAVMIVSAPAAGLADCPDKMKCGYWTESFPPEQKQAGVVENFPTCYKFGSGCKPWHCEGGNYKTEDQCKQICVQKFTVLQGKKKIYVDFPTY